ncbi:MAG: YbhB/YbcL family Raf kinase inhibitor-like protein [Steroidobacteraceae bacterium]|jgi:Raf kinase inhibitor-like YbhB/YbcL family protein
MGIASRIAAGAFAAAAFAAAFGAAAPGGLAADDTFKLQSAVVAPNGTLANEQVFNGFGCSGKNVSPPLRWSGAPAGTRSFALTVYDPDAPTGSGWWHWVVFDIPASVSELPQGAGNAAGQLPAGTVQGRTDFGAPGYGGPCPPAGDKPHRYIFTVYALKTAKLDVPSGGSAAMVGFMINANKLASASIIARYGR